MKGDWLILKKATRGISKGKWNAPGGRVIGNESPLECAKREVLEETGLKVNSAFYHGTLSFYMWGKQSLGTRVHLFSTKNYIGRFRSTSEGELKWFKQRELPFDQMWPDDRFWLPLMVIGSSFDAKFYLDDTNTNIVRYSILSRNPADSNPNSQDLFRQIRYKRSSRLLLA